MTKNYDSSRYYGLLYPKSLFSEFISSKHDHHRNPVHVLEIPHDLYLMAKNKTLSGKAQVNKQQMRTQEIWFFWLQLPHLLLYFVTFIDV